MRITEWLNPLNPCRQFEGHERLFQALKNLNNAAILCVQHKAMPSVRKYVHQFGLPADQADEVLNQSSLIFLRKIEEGTYQFQGHSPVTYLVEIAKRVALSMTRKHQKSYETLENHSDLHDPAVDASHRQRESAELVQQFLGQMGEPCASVIRLHHIDGYSDEEVVKQGWTRYTTTDSLKIKRSDCMKKLILIAQEWRNIHNI
jgi:RNA polymerase sigma factor (sigma-70 family)